MYIYSNFRTRLIDLQSLVSLMLSLSLASFAVNAKRKVMGET